MRNKLVRALVISILLMLAAFGVSAGEQIYDLEGGSLRLSHKGHLVGIKTQSGQITLADVRLDAGIDGAFLQNSLGFQRFYDLNTWDLARIIPKAKPDASAQLLEVKQEGQALTVRSQVEGMELVKRYAFGENGLRIDASIISRREQVSEVQGILLQLQGVKTGAETHFRYPGNAPYDVFRLQSLRPFRPQTSAYCAPVVRVDGLDQANGVNLVFLHSEEKWATGVWNDRENALNAAFLVMAEGLIKPGEEYALGPLFLQLTSPEEAAHTAVQALYTQLRYQAPAPLPGADGPMYSLHPAGTMDRGMNRPQTMSEFARVLPDLHAMGINTLWLLPVFEHSGRGVYEPVDQAVLDPRYGQDSDLLAFSQQAHSLGMRVLLDYVPHGPRPEDSLAKENPQWCSIHRSGRQQIEWDCVSFDMTKPGYLAYTRKLSQGHAARFDTDGGRIDCAMGGLSNWQAGEGKRASSSGLSGGMSIVDAIRAGYKAAGKQALLMPENFHPLPAYAPLSDIFYDMPLYRVMHDMRENKLDETDFAVTLGRWLQDEYSFGVPGQKRLRFLGNHDTVSWTWDRARATEVYGVEKAKALWTLFSFIDGVPFLYQGDEYSPIYDPRTLVDLRPFFTGLFTARAEHITPDMGIAYHETNSTLLAFTRSNQEKTLLGLVNLGDQTVDYPLMDGANNVLYGEAGLQEGKAVLGPYQTLLVQLP